MTIEDLLHRLRQDLRDGGLTGSFLVRNLHTGDELGIDPDTVLPIASLAKLPLALATAERIRRGDLSGATRIRVEPGRITSPGPTGLSRFQHPATIAVDDLLYLSTSVSDGTAADALFDLTPPDTVAGILAELGLKGITVRHTMRELSDTPAERFSPADAHLALALAIDGGTSGRGHRVPQLDVSSANTGTARAFIDFLQAVWTPSTIAPQVAERVRSLMGANLLVQRLSPDFSSDAAAWSSKTATLLNLRHEVGVVAHDNGHAFAVAALTESRVAASSQPAAEALMGQVARTLRDTLRSRP
ncbi:serine hydrolase [Phytomonospora sp. NPDC050363]|uniref:serine hydrolase n=1 Tax=Phytomonospora sp. NPDC050363 TaxID=3155642 RepID=UPI0033EBA8BC